VSRWRPETVLLPLTDGDVAARLDALEPRRGTRLHAVLAGDLVRYGLVRWSDEFTSPAERQVLAQQYFVETFGEAARGWAVCQHSHRHGAATLASAVDRNLIDALDAAAAARGLHVVAIEPHLAHVFNAVRRRIDADLFWFVTVEPQWTTLLLVSSREPLHVKRLPPLRTTLSTLLDREWFALGIEGERCPAYVMRSGPPSPVRAATAAPAPMSANWQIVDLSLVPGRASPSALLRAA